ncbi:MAG: PilT/PilU family type 4a pilus ATPase [Deltaproteobacteria bacterium]|nr:PilT/PilU family type 4a pilus ATPase [Deltaproteobacteria bacterium]
MERFKNIINSAIKEVISDIYIAGGHPMVSRKHGNIEFHPTVKWSHQEVDALARKLLTAHQLTSLQSRKSVDFAISISQARLRINVFTTTRGLSLAIRILPGHIPTIEELNLHPSLNEIATLKSGLVLYCGPTGVGKTTSVAAIINEINNTRFSHIITLENPIEYRFQSNKAFIQQRELDTHMPSFSQGLLDVLRENPDVIVVGEMREPETMRLTLNAAESGHLVLATMHASSPEEAIYRLCNSVPVDAQNEIRFQLASTLSWLIVQQLTYIARVGFRVPLLTIVRGTPSVKNTIRENKLHQLPSAIQVGKNDGMFSSERYYSEYLESREKFTPPMLTFRPSNEIIDDIVYRSPLTEGNLEQMPLERQATRKGPEPIVIRTEYSAQDMEQILTIDEDASLHDVISKMGIR